MCRILLPLAAILAACTPSPRESAMSSRSPVPPTTARIPDGSGPTERTAAAADRVAYDPGKRDQAAQGPMPEAVSAAGRPLPVANETLSADAEGRRTLSTAFVRVDAHGHLTVALRDGRVLVLRDVVMRAADYCGMEIIVNAHERKFCGGYAEILAAQPGPTPIS